MSRSIVRAWILVAWGLVAGVALFAIQGHERTLRHGELVLLRLAPVDPRSLMQGDYMALRFAVDAELASVSGETESPKQNRPSFAYFTLDESRRAEFTGTGESPRHAAGQIRSWRGAPRSAPMRSFFRKEPASFSRQRSGAASGLQPMARRCWSRYMMSNCSG